MTRRRPKPRSRQISSAAHVPSVRQRSRPGLQTQQGQRQAMLPLQAQCLCSRKRTHSRAEFLERTAPSMAVVVLCPHPVQISDDAKQLC